MPVSDEHQKMRLAVAEANEFSLYKSYREKEACDILKKEASWFKRHRKAGNIPFIRDAGGGISYLGLMLADMMILGKEAKGIWDDNLTPLGSGISTNETKAQDGIGADTTKEAERSAVLRLALNALKKPNGN